MLIVCPCCFARVDILAALEDEDARAMVGRLADLGALAAPVVGYLALFRPRGRALAWSRARRLVGELADAVEAGRVRRRGREHEVPPDVWPEALAAVVAARDAGRLSPPLRDHAYLWECAISGAERAAAAAERTEEEARRQAARARPRGPGAVGGPRRLDPEATRRRLGEMWAAVGRRPPTREEEPT